MNIYLHISPPVVFPLGILLYYLAYAEAKVLLVETKSVKSVRDTVVEDYSMSVFGDGEDFNYERNCKKYCRFGRCEKRPNPRTDILMFLQKFVYTCRGVIYVDPVTTQPPQPPPPPPTTTEPMPNANCLKTPRSRKGRVNKWGFRVRKSGKSGRSNFCCSRTGDLVRTPRCYRPKTPRNSCS